MAEHASTPAPGALHGEALHAFIDQAHELATGDEESGAPAAIGPQERLAAAAELMGQQSFAPANVIELERVHDLWLLLDRPETANAFLQRHRATAVQAGDRPGAVPVADLITHTMPLERFVDGIGAVTGGTAIKVTIEP